MLPTRGGPRRHGSLVAASLIAALGVGALFLLPYLPGEVPSFVPPSLAVTVILALVWIVLRIMGQLFEKVTASKMGSWGQARSMWRVVSYVVLGIVMFSLILVYLGDVTSTALSVGLVGAALAFVLQKPLLNLAGWLIITYRQVYRIGDRIEVQGARGYVTDINLMYTELQEFGNWMNGDTFTGRLVTVPNAVVVEGPTFNYTRDFPFVWDEVEILVTYESDIDVAKGHLTNAAMEVVGGVMYENFEKYRQHLALRDLEDSLLTTPEIRMTFADSGVRLFVVFFCPVDMRRRLKGLIVEKVWRRFMADPRVEIAYPHMTIVPRLSDRDREGRRQFGEDFLGASQDVQRSSREAP